MVGLASAAAGLTYLFWSARRGSAAGLAQRRTGRGPARQRSSVSTKIRPAGRSASAGTRTADREQAALHIAPLPVPPPARPMRICLPEARSTARSRCHSSGSCPNPPRDFAIRDWPAMLPEDLKHSGPARETDREEPPETPGPSQPLSREVIDDVLLIADTLWRRPVPVRTCSEGTLQADSVRETSRRRSRSLRGG